MRIPASVPFGFPPAPEADLLLYPELEHLNFRELPPGTAFGRRIRAQGLGIEVRDESGADLSARYFQIEQGELRLRQGVMPSMLTLNETIIRDDCLCSQYSTKA